MRQFSDDSFAEGIVRTTRLMIGWEVERLGVSFTEARRIIAREARIAPGAIERLLAGRLKFAERISGALNATLVRKVERRIAELEHIRAVALATNNRPRPIDLDGLESALAMARKAIGKD